MNRPTPERSDDLDNTMANLVAEAGDPGVVLRPEHAAELRTLLLDRLNPRPIRRPWKTGLFVGSGIAAMVIVAVTLTFSRPAIAWAQVADALQKRPWIHTKSLGPDGKQFAESWVNTKQGSVAYSHRQEIGYHDHQLRIFNKFVPAEGILYRLPQISDGSIDQPDFLDQLISSKEPIESPLPGTDVIKQTRTEVVDQGRHWLDIKLILRVIGNPKVIFPMILRVDPRTNLPQSWKSFSHNEGTWTTTLFDYPDRGPVDIYDLGVPRTAKVIDRIPGDDLGRVLAGLKAGRARFDDYRGIMEWGDGMNIKRAWRKGRKWRVEALRSSAKKWPPFPRDADAAWWKAHQDDYASEVQAICDGEKVYYYRANGIPLGPDAKSSPTLKLDMTQEINPSDDPFMPWPYMFPEHIGHPSVWQPSDDREMLIDPKPDDGPPGTIRLRVRNPKGPKPDAPDLYRLWIKPDQNYLSLRSETCVFESINPPKIAYIDTQMPENLAKSPQGHWYPTRVRRKTSNFPTEQVTNFYLDFDAKIPDELFQPLKLAD